jgi:hypothetical protein
MTWRRDKLPELVRAVQRSTLRLGRVSPFGNT